jgi:hypothetical protein
MIEQNEWVYFKEIDWNCPNNNRFNVDTRDFHCGYRFEKKTHPDWKTISKYDNFFFTEHELKSEIRRLFDESGGDGEWRYLDLEHLDPRVRNWRLKYLRIWRTEKGFVICNSDDKAIPKSILSSKVDQKYLHKH